METQLSVLGDGYRYRFELGSLVRFDASLASVVRRWTIKLVTKPFHLRRRQFAVLMMLRYDAFLDPTSIWIRRMLRRVPA